MFEAMVLARAASSCIATNIRTNFAGRDNGHTAREDSSMKIERVTSPHVVEPPPGRWSNALRVGDMLFISGMVSRANDGRSIEGRDEYEQAKVIFGKIRSLVEAAGGAMADVVKVTIYVVNIKNNTEVWRARQEVFSGDFPCSTLVDVRSLAPPEILVEIEASACVGAV